MHTPNPRHHSLSAFWQNRPDRRKVGDTLTAISSEDDVTYQWLDDGEEIEGATDDELLVTSLMVGSRISVTVTNENGDTATSDPTKPVVNDKSAEITLADNNGLQEDGTALGTDTLEVSYGADLGTPKYVTWYCNGSVVKVGSLDGAGIAPTDMKMVGTVAAPLKNGDWYVVIENTAGDISISNTIVVNDEGRAIITDFSISEDMTTTANIDIATISTHQVINFTMNKDYEGTFYLIEADKTTFKTSDMVGAGAWVTETTLNTNIKKVKASKFTDKAAIDPATAGTTKGIKIENADGSYTYKIYNSGTGLTRGKKYRLVFDQAEIDSDDIKVNKAGSATNATTENPNVTDESAVPYLPAPESIELSGYTSTGTTAKVTFYDEDGAALTWWTVSNDKTGLSSVAIYPVASNAISASDPATNPTAFDMKEGALAITFTAGGAGKDFAYAKATTTKGIFGKDSVTLTSEVAEEVSAPMTKMEIKDDGTTAKVAFTGLKKAASGKVYILQGDATNNDFDKIGAKDLSSALGSADVEGGVASVTIEDVFEGSQLEAANVANSKNKFVAVFVPDMTDVYKTVKNGDGTGEVFTLKQKATSVKTSGTNFTALGAANVLTIKGLVAFDQFGNQMRATVDKATASVSAIDSTGVNKEGANAVYEVTAGDAADGLVTLTISDSSAAYTAGGTANVLDKNDGYKVTVLGTDLEITNPTAAKAWSNAYQVSGTGGTIKIKVAGAEVGVGLLASAVYTDANATALTGQSNNPAVNLGADSTTAVGVSSMFLVDQYGVALPAGVVIDAASAIYTDAAATTLATTTDFGGGTILTVNFAVGASGQLFAKLSADDKITVGGGATANTGYAKVTIGSQSLVVAITADQA